VPNVTLVEEIASKRKYHWLWEKYNFIVGQLLLWLAIAASIAASISAALKWTAHPQLMAIVAAIPAAVALIGKTFQHTARHSWHSLFRTRLSSLERAIRDQNLPIKEASERLNALEEDMENRFPPLRDFTG
jgi:hypothetical protein